VPRRNFSWSVRTDQRSTRLSQTAGWGEVQHDAGMGEQPAFDRGGLVVEALSSTTCTSNSAGTSGRWLARNFLNSRLGVERAASR
jgi:hypothetical protein